jgi:hypothetical protein
MIDDTTPAALKEGLYRFTGTDRFHNHWTHKLVYTDGVQWIADRAQAHWLTDAIASWQLHPEVKGEEFQSWTLRRLPEGAVLTCDDGNGRIVARQDIEYTDFPLPEITLWLEYGTLMLPSER